MQSLLPVRFWLLAALNTSVTVAVTAVTEMSAAPSTQQDTTNNTYGTDDTGAGDGEQRHDHAGSIYFNRWALTDNVLSKVVPTIFGLVFVIGLVGNGTLIISVLANKVMRNVPNILIASLSLGDFLLLLVSVPLTSVIYTFNSWPFGMVMCKVNEYMQTLSLGVSIFTLTALSADRYVAIVDPMAKLTGCTQKTTIAIALSIWFLSAVLAIPDAVVSKEVFIYQANMTHAYCTPYPEDIGELYAKITILVRFVVFFLLPVLTIGFFYAMMARILIRSSQSVPTESKAGAANHCRQIAARKKVARVVLSFVIIFIVCWLPRYVFLLWYHFDEALMDEFWFGLKIAAFCLQFINSCVNPFALYFLSGQFRKYYNRYLFCCCCRVRYSSLESTSVMHNLNSTNRRASPTNMSLLHSQSTC